jgi:hypothetical protein
MVKKMFYPLFALVVALSLAGAASAQSKTLKGKIVDKACSAGLAKKDGAAATADAHSGSEGCAMKTGCQKSGHGVFAEDGKYYTFDAKGNELSVAALKGASKKTGATFNVVGKVTGDTIAVESISEVQ